MDFELQNLEIIENLNPSQSTDHHREGLKSQSAILNEIHKENEELQNKLKLNYRRLLLFEAENNKLIEEKNRLFFEAQTSIEKANLLTERNNELETENNEVEEKIQFLNEKIYTLEKINKSQLTEIKRFSKFHLKIQNVVKPYIIQLKNQLALAQKDFQSTLIQLNLYKKLNHDINQKNATLTDQLEAEKNIYQIDKTQMISSYEEQIHSFSKEILAQQHVNDGLVKEISRLKKANEFKNYFENELIKFKRIHEEDQFKYQGLLDQKNDLETQTIDQNEKFTQAKIELEQFKTRLEEKENVLEVTRKQLAKHLDESVFLNERLHRLEKLNNQLSREMSLSNK